MTAQALQNSVSSGHLNSNCTKWMVLPLALLGLALSTGCNNNSSNKASTVSQQVRDQLPVSNSLGQIYGNYSTGTGRLYVGQQSGAEFTTTMKYLVAAYIDPANVGDVDPVSGATFRGYVAMNAAGQLDTATSGIEIDIRDSYAVKGTDDNGNKLDTLHLGAGATQLNVSSNTATVVFHTSGADYTFQGNFDTNTYSGFFKFSNKSSYASSEPNHSGENIAFSVPTCQFFKCQ